MDWKNLIEDLIARGLPIVTIAERCGKTPQAVSALRHGRASEPVHSFGEALKALSKSHRPRKPPSPRK